MITEEIKNRARAVTHPTRWQRGNAYYKEGNVYGVDFATEEDYLIIDAQVEGSRSYRDYESVLGINLENLNIEKTRCTCEDYRENNRRGTYICKHIVATLLEAMEIMENTNRVEALSNIHEEINKASKLTPEDIILGNITNDYKKINLEVHMDACLDEPYCKIQFKIGEDKMYVLKSPRDFIVSRYSNKEVKYGKDFTYNPKKHIFSVEDENIISYMDEMVSINEQLSVVPKYRRQIELVEGKVLNIAGKSLKRFLLAVGNKSIKFKINNSEYEPKLIYDDLPLSFNIEEKEENIILTTDENMPIPLNDKRDVFFYNGNLYLPNESQYNGYRNFYEFLKEDGQIKFSKSRAGEVIQKVIPKLDEISKNINIDEKITKKIKKDLKIEFYLDRKKESVYLDLKFIYNDENNNEEFYIIRDIKKENHAKSVLNNLLFEEESKNKFLFKGRELDLYKLLSDDIKELKSLGDVYYSDKFKYKIETPSISASINENKDRSFLEINFNIENVDEKEYKNILKSFKENKRFHKLKNDTILDLSNDDAKEFFKLLDNVVGDISKDIKQNIIKLNNNKAIYLNESMKNSDFKFISGKEYLKSIAQKIDTMNEVVCEVPQNLNATLRDYQIDGYKWFNTLSHFEFGGILADEMGLGKTIQTITFLLSNCNKKTLIVTPTSLIYNWKDEFENFAPQVKVLIMHGDKNFRMELFDSMNEYDVILTTYSTLRNDYEHYEKKYFDYMIIDEGQNIKNPNAQNTKCVKDINAGVKFALTGTPMENNLVELWSIFDYIMPGYLFSKKAFEEKFIKGKKENLKELKKMINPFILRRMKKDVLSELPDKIEKKFFVEMNKDQKKVYTAVVKDINEKRENKEFNEDNITIFSYLTKLRQLCLDPSILMQDYKGKSAKIDVCLELIKEAISDNHKILLFSQFTTVLKKLGDKLEEENIKYSYLDGAISAAKRTDLVNEFNESNEKQVFLISLKAGGTGLNLTSADIVIHFDPWWNPAIEDQATDRAHRFGQKNMVEVIKLIAKGTVEEKIIKLQDDKKELIANIMSGDMNNSSLLSSLSEEDINDLFKVE